MNSPSRSRSPEADEPLQITPYEVIKKDSILFSRIFSDCRVQTPTPDDLGLKPTQLTNRPEALE